MLYQLSYTPAREGRALSEDIRVGNIRLPGGDRPVQPRLVSACSPDARGRAYLIGTGT